MSTTQLVRTVRPVSKTVTTTTISKEKKKNNKPKRKMQKQKKKNLKTPNQRLPTPAAQWIRTLNDPFEHGPVKLGMGTMVNTQLFTSYFRGQVAANADGSLCVAFSPSVGTAIGSIQVCNAGFTTATWTNYSMANQAAISPQCSQARVISAGLRVIPLVAQTAAPGMVYVGSIPAVTQGQIAATTISTLVNNPNIEPSVSQNVGSVALSRPQDTTSFEFLTQAILGGASAYHQWSTPIVAFSGLPGAVSVYIEAVVHIEGFISNQTSISSSTQFASATTDWTANTWGTLENLYQFVASKITSSSMPNISERLLDRATNIALETGTNYLQRRRNRFAALTIEDVD